MDKEDERREDDDSNGDGDGEPELEGNVNGGDHVSNASDRDLDDSDHLGTGTTTTTAPSWLLRLFRSDFFDCWIAIHYLHTYADPGVQNYLCEQLRRFPVHQIMYYLPQLCNLLLTRPQESAALEYFLLDMSCRSTHFSLLLLWYLDAYMEQFSNFEDHDNHTIMCYYFCLNVYKKCQSIVTDAGHTSPDVLLANVWRRGSSKYLGENARYFLLAVSLKLASVACPELVRRLLQDVRQYTHRVVDLPSESSLYRNSVVFSGASDRSDSKLSSARLVEEHSPSVALGTVLLTREPPLLEALNRGDAFSLPRLAILQFMNYLTLISNRLQSLPKSQRQHTLVADISLLNYNLPAKICLPLWCTADRQDLQRQQQHNGETDKVADDDHHWRNHDQVVRISPLDAVVLNSNNRAPFLLSIEILTADPEGGTFESAPMNDVKVHAASAVESYVRNMETENNADGPQSLDSPLASNSEQLRSNDGLAEGANGFTSRRGLSPSPFVSMARISAVTPPLAPPTLPTPLEDNADSNSLEDVITRMKTAAVMLSQLNSGEISATPQEMANIRDRIVHKISELIGSRLPDSRLHTNGDSIADTSIIHEGWVTKASRIQRESPYGQLPNWRLVSVIVKCGEDMRQEQLACQLMTEMDRIWRQASLPIWIYNYRVIVTSGQSGLIETVPDAVSIHSIKKDAYARSLNGARQEYLLLDHFKQRFGEVGSEKFAAARESFIRSLAGYSLISYLLNVKDRHDGNILLDQFGHLIHVDFGFMLDNSPGSVGFEIAPFKLSQEYLDVIGGLQSEGFRVFKELFLQGFLALRRYADHLARFVEIMRQGSNLPCFSLSRNNLKTAVDGLRERFQVSLTDDQVAIYAESLISTSYNNLSSQLYDQYQYYTNGIF